MKWYEKIEITKPSLLVFFIFLILGYRSKEIEWWPEFFFIMAEAALSVVIVLKIIEVWSRREKIRRWKKVELLVYSEILDNLVYIYYWIWQYVELVDFIFITNSPYEIHKGLYNLAKYMTEYEASSQLSFKASTLASKIKKLIEKPWITPFQLIPYNFILSKNEQDKDTECIPFFMKTGAAELDRLIDLLIESRKSIPKAIQLSDDEELGLRLQRYEIKCSKLILTLKGQKRDQESTELNIVNIPPIIKDSLLLLNTSVDLCELIQQNIVKTEKNWKEDLIQNLKYWWLPPKFWE